MTRSEQIQRYRTGPAAVGDSLQGLSDEQLDQRPADGGWTVRQIVHHLADIEMAAAVRVRRLVAERAPVLPAVDGGEYASALHYQDRPIEPSLHAITGAVESTASLLEHLSEEDWQRRGTHSALGVFSVARWLSIHADHCHDHADQIRRVVGSQEATPLDC